MSKTGIAVAAALLALAPGCEMPPMVPATSSNTHLFESGPSVEGDEAKRLAGMGEPAITHGAASRSLTRRLGGMLEAILESTLPEVASLHADLDAAASALKPPERLRTDDPTLATWGEAGRAAYRATVDVFYDEARRRLQGLQEAAIDAAGAQARGLAPISSPLDAGATGDSSLDTAVTTFAEVVDGAIGLRDVDVRHQQDRSLQLDLYQIFSTFGAKAADGETDAELELAGRLMLFVGGDETLGSPRALLAFRSDEDEPDAHRFAQVMRHRIMRGGSVAADLGWRAAPAPGEPGTPVTSTMEHFLIASHVEPAVDRTAPSFAQLTDMRIVVDIQSALVDADDEVLGGVDWRIEFQVSAKGALTWQLVGAPKYDPYCSEVKRVLGL